MIGVIEYVDVNEENNCLVALCEEDITPEHTHMEIDPLTILGVVAGWAFLLMHRRVSE
jgi:DNA-directed RNA polymerase III subunit RPC2